MTHIAPLPKLIGMRRFRTFVSLLICLSIIAAPVQAYQLPISAAAENVLSRVTNYSPKTAYRAFFGIPRAHLAKTLSNALTHQGKNQKLRNLTSGELVTGEQFDQSLDNYYLRARYYDQGVGRFGGMDTWPGSAFDPRTLHKYVYTAANPIGWVDPSGHSIVAAALQAVSLRAVFANLSITAGRFFTKKLLKRSLLALGFVALSGGGYLASVASEAREEARADLEELVLAKALNANILFHYTDLVGAQLIASCSCILASRGFRHHPDGGFRPPGAYATILSPWLSGWSQWDLRSVLYARPASHVVTHFVAFLETPGWLQLDVAGAEWYFPAPPLFPVPIEIVHRGANLMTP